MRKEITVLGHPAKKGTRMTRGRHWQIEATKGKKRVFPATLVSTYNFGDLRLALFSVRK